MKISAKLLWKICCFFYRFDYIKSGEQKIMSQIKMLENPEDLKDQRLSSVSTNFESTDNDDKN